MNNNLTAEQVMERIREAMVTVSRMPAVGPRNVSGQWPDTVRNFVEINNLAWDPDPVKPGWARLPPPRIVPTSKQIAEMDEVLGWLLWLPAELRQAVEAHGLGMSYRDIGLRLRMGGTTAYRRHCEGIKILVKLIPLGGPKKNTGTNGTKNAIFLDKLHERLHAR